MFVALEGIEHSGKDVQTRLLEDYCTQNHIEAFFTREPTVENYDLICNEIKTHNNSGKKGLDLQKIMVKDRIWHLKEQILPALSQGKMVFCNRYAPSSYAYGMSEGCTFEQIDSLHHGLLFPDIVIYLTISPNTAMVRSKKAEKESVRFDQLNFLTKLHNNYLIALSKLSKKNKSKICIVNGEQAPEVVHGFILERIFRQSG